MKILYLATEAYPFASTGGLGDVLGSLPSSVKMLGHDVRIMIPLYGSIPQSFREKMKKECDFTVYLSWRRLYSGVFSLEKKGVTYYFLDNEYYFKRASLYGEYDDGERFAFFSMAALEAMKYLGFYPDILHANDWQTALSIIYLGRFFKWREEYSEIKTVFTIHNIEYQGKFDPYILGDVFGLDESELPLLRHDGCINLMKGAIEASDAVTTVSPRYAEEIMTEEFSHGLSSILRKNAHKLIGVLNGIDCILYNPETDPRVTENFSAENRLGKKTCKEALQRELGLPEKDVPLISVISRLVPHKGIDLIVDTVFSLLEERHVQLVVLGQGDSRFECFFRALEDKFPEKVRALITFDRDLSRRIYSATDVFLMPSKSEPCGLSQMIASRYGAIPIVRETGGLFDSIKPYFTEGDIIQGNGFTFWEYSGEALRYQIESALALLKSDMAEKLIYKVMTADFSWEKSALEYENLYLRLTEKKEEK